MGVQSRVIDKVIEERNRQDEKWGYPQHNYFEWFAILVEEVGEIAKELNGGDDIENLKTEITQVAAVAIAMLEAINKRDSR